MLKTPNTGSSLYIYIYLPGPVFGHTKILQSLLKMGSAALAVAVQVKATPISHKGQWCTKRLFFLNRRKRICTIRQWREHHLLSVDGALSSPAINIRRNYILLGQCFPKTDGQLEIKAGHQTTQGKQTSTHCRHRSHSKLKQHPCLRLLHSTCMPKN